MQSVGSTYDPTAENTSGWSSEQWGAGGGAGLTELIHTLRFDKLMTEIEGSLHYPRVLGDRQISGVINVRLRFREGSRCAWPPRIEGAAPYLRVYVLALLKKICGFEILTTMGFVAGQTVDLSFAFVLTDRPDAGRGAPGRIAGNVLMFERTYPARALSYQLGPIRGVWFAPVVSLDWGWVVEHWEQWVDHKDPLAAFRDSTQ